MNEMSQFLTSYGGPMLFLAVFVEEAGLPLPAAPWMLAAGALAATGKLSPVMAIGVTVLAAILADSIWFYIGRRSGQRILRLFCRLSLSRNTCVGSSKNLFARHGFQALVAAKFLPGLGTVMPPLAGALGMSTGRFVLYDGIGSLIYGTFYIALGFLFHNQLNQALAVLSRLGFSALVLLTVLIAAYIAFKYLRRRKAAYVSMHGNAGSKTPTESVHPSAVPAVVAFNTLAGLPSVGVNTLANISLTATSSSASTVTSSNARSLVAHST